MTQSSSPNATRVIDLTEPARSAGCPEPGCALCALPAFLYRLVTSEVALCARCFAFVYARPEPERSMA